MTPNAKTCRIFAVEMETRVIDNNELRFGAAYELTEKEYFYRMVGIFSAAHVPEDKHLSGRELEYFYCAYKCIKNGSRDLISNDNISRYFKTFKDRNTAKTWLKRVQDKLWIDEYNGKYSLVGDFETLYDTTKFRVDLYKIKDK